MIVQRSLKSLIMSFTLFKLTKKKKEKFFNTFKGKFLHLKLTHVKKIDTTIFLDI